MPAEIRIPACLSIATRFSRATFRRRIQSVSQSGAHLGERVAAVQHGWRAVYWLSSPPWSCRSSYTRQVFRKPIKIIVYTKQGGPIDLTARRFVEMARFHTDATFVVEYKTGAGGIVAMEHLLQSRADGYTLLACTKSNIAKMVSTGREEYLPELDWIALLMTDPECVITRRSGPFADWNALVQDGQQHSDEQLWGGPSRGGLDHVTALQIWDRFHIAARWIPFEGGDQALQGLLTDQVVAYVGNPGDAAGQPDLQVSIVSSRQRLPQLPDTPTFGEFGFPDLDDLYMWRGFALRKGCPPLVKQWYADLFSKVTADPRWQRIWDRDGIQVKYIPEAEFTTIVEANRQEFRTYLDRLDMLPSAQTRAAMRWFAQPGLQARLLMLLVHVAWAAWLARRQLAKQYGHFVVLSCLISSCLLLFWETTKFPPAEGARAAAVPRLWMALVGLLTIATIVWPPQPGETRTAKRGRIDLVVVLALILVVHVGLTLYVGYYLSTALFLIVTMFLLGERRWSVLLGVSLVWLVFAYLSFSRLLFVPLPLGRWTESFT